MLALFWSSARAQGRDTVAVLSIEGLFRSFLAARLINSWSSYIDDVEDWIYIDRPSRTETTRQNGGPEEEGWPAGLAGRWRRRRFIDLFSITICGLLIDRKDYWASGEAVHCAVIEIHRLPDHSLNKTWALNCEQINIQVLAFQRSYIWTPFWLNFVDP